MRTHITALFLSLITLSLPAIAQKSQLPEDRRFAGLDTAFQRVLNSWHGAGFAVAVVQGDKVIYANGFGYRNIAKKQKVTANTIFPIGSCTKAFTAALIGKLDDAGKLDIDKPAVRYLPSLRFYNDAMNNTITLRDMMSHRTGLSRYDMSWYFFNVSTIDSMVQRIQYMEPNAGIRERWEYNNFMYAAQGAIVQQLTGKSWGDNIEEDLLKPLDMDHSNVSIPELQKFDEISTGYTIREDNSIKELPYYHLGGMAPAGSINSNVYDMAKWLIAWINNGKYKDRVVIPAGYRNAAISSQSIIDGSLPGKSKPGIYFSNYGFGWFVDSYQGHYRVEHGGNVDGFTAMTSFFPSDSIGIVVLSNQGESMIPVTVRNLIADRVLGLKYYDWNTQYRTSADKSSQARDKEQEEKTSQAKHNPPTHPLSDFAGSYSHPAYGTMVVYVSNDSLYAKTPTHTLWLRHGSYDAFELIDKDPIEGVDPNRSYGIDIQFHLDLSGTVDGFESVLEGGLKPFLFVKQTNALHP